MKKKSAEIHTHTRMCKKKYLTPCSYHSPATASNTAGMNEKGKETSVWGLCVKGTPSESQFIDCDAFLASWELLGEVRLQEDLFTSPGGNFHVCCWD